MTRKREYRIKELERRFNGKTEIYYQAQYTEYFLFFKYWVDLWQEDIHKFIVESRIESHKKYSTKKTVNKFHYY